MFFNGNYFRNALPNIGHMSSGLVSGMGRALMDTFRRVVTLIGGISYAGVAFALLPPAGAPAGTTAICKDGSYFFGQSKSDACKTHGGVNAWYEVADTSAKGTPSDSARAPSSPNPSAAARSVAEGANAPPSTSNAPSRASVEAANASAEAANPPGNIAAAQDPAPGGGSGLVWVSDGSKVYRCEGDKLYGRTKPGKYLSERDAKSKGLEPQSGKTCS
jgi:hypothetical protein